MLLSLESAKVKNFGFPFALCSLILQHHFVAEASQRAERVTLASPMLLSLESAKAKNFGFPFALCSLIRNFVPLKDISI